MNSICSSNYIHPTSIIDDGVFIGTNNYIGPYCIIRSNVIIGNNNRIESHSIIGSLPENKESFIVGTSWGVIIGDNNTIREFTTINAGVNINTRIGDNNIILRGSHIGHDCIIGDKNTISCNTILGGHTTLGDGINCGLGTITHQYSKLGSYSMTGMGTIVTKSSEIKPGEIHVGNPAKYLKQNIIGLERNNISQEKLERLLKQYERL